MKIKKELDKDDINLKASWEEEGKIILDSKNLGNYFYVLIGIIAVIGTFYIISFILGVQLNISSSNQGTPQIDSLPPSIRPPLFNLFALQINIWPIWGYFSFPSLFQLFIFAITIITFVFIISYHNQYNKSFNLWIITIVGIILIILTNLINGWDKGIVNSISEDISQNSALFYDVLNIDNIFTFISTYEEIQSSLTVHARTHPPGVILVVYIFYIFLNHPGLIAIGLCVLSSVSSVYFFKGFLKRFFNQEISNYVLFLFLLLPAVQIYYLANVYAIVGTLILGVIYFYFHSNKFIRINGSIACVFLATFISFMAGFIIICLFLYELMNANYSNRNEDGIGKFSKFKNIIQSLKEWFIVISGLAFLYLLLLIFGKFNYINSFFIAAESESNSMAFSSFFSYVATRFADILDILIFFGPVLIVLSYKGFKLLKYEINRDKSYQKLYYLCISAVISLMLIFLTGAYDHGETARAAIYIYSFLIIPIAFFLSYKRFNAKEKVILLGFVFGQSLLMQLFGFYIW